jgi:hypothetical protein
MQAKHVRRGVESGAVAPSPDFRAKSGDGAAQTDNLCLHTLTQTQPQDAWLYMDFSFDLSFVLFASFVVKEKGIST